MVWSGDDNETDKEEIFYSIYEGGAWSDPPEVVSGTVYGSYQPQIALDADGSPHVVWTGDDEDSGSGQIFYSANTGGGWSSPEIVSIGDDYPYNPQIAVELGGYAHVAWHGHIDGPCAIYYNSNAGGDWSDPGPRLLSTTSEASGSEPDIAVDSDGHAQVVFDGWDYDDDESYIYYTANIGEGWIVPPEVLSTTSFRELRSQDSAGLE